MIDKRTKEHRQLRQDQKRVPAGQPRMQLTVSGLEKGFRHYWAKPYQFEELMAAGYSLVKEDGIEVGTTGDGNTDLGSIVSKVGDRYTGERLYLLKIREDWYDENQAIKQAENDKTMQAINRKPGDGYYTPDQNKVESEIVG